MRSTVGAWVVFDVILTTSQWRTDIQSHGSDCQALRLTGTHDPSMSGIFVKDSAVTSHGKPVYRQEVGRYTLCAVGDTRWIVTLSPHCAKTGARVFVDDVVSYPHHVTATWRECVPREGNPRCWSEAPSIRVTCEAHSDDVNPDKVFTSQLEKPKECELIRLVNATLDSNAIYEGVYRKTDVTCNHRYVYRKPGAYIVYWAGLWRAHSKPESCVNTGGDVTVRPLVRRLRYINPDEMTWSEWNGSRYVPSQAAITCEEVWILYLALVVAAVVTVIITVIAVIAVKKKHSQSNRPADNDVGNDVTTPATVGFDTKHGSVSDDGQDPDELLIIDNVIYTPATV